MSHPPERLDFERCAIRRLKVGAAAVFLLFATGACGAVGADGVPASKSISASEKPQANASKKADSPSASASKPQNTPTKPLIKKPVRADYVNIDDPAGYGAAETHDYLMAAFRYAYLTGDTSGMQEVSAASCEACRDFIEDVADEERRVSKADWKIDPAEAESETSRRNVTYAHMDAKTTWANSGKTSRESLTLAAVMEWNGARWQATDMWFEDEE